MALGAQDLLLDDNDDLQIVDGDFVIDQSDLQNADLVIRSAPGNWLMNVLIGFNIYKWLKGKVDKYRFERELKIQLEEMEGYVIKEISIVQTPDGGFTVEKLILE